MVSWFRTVIFNPFQPSLVIVRLLRKKGKFGDLQDLGSLVNA